MKKLLIPVIAALALSACGIKMEESTYLCTGEEKTFNPVLNNLSYVGHDSDKFSYKKDVRFKLTVKHNDLPYARHMSIANQYLYASAGYEGKRNGGALHHNKGQYTYIHISANDTYVEDMGFDTKTGLYNTVLASYKENAGDSTRLMAISVTTVQAVCVQK